MSLKDPDSLYTSSAQRAAARVKERPTLSIIVPAYNEAEVLDELHRRLSAVIDGLGVTAELIYVNDGSRDATLDILYRLHSADPRVAVLNLSRNFGKEIAMTAGLDHSRGEATVIIDADLQDPPELIPELMTRWSQGYDVVYATRLSRDGESALKKLSARYFYRVIGGMSPIEIPKDTGDFRLLSRRAVDALCRLREQHRFMKGLFAWIGYRQTAVTYHRDRRSAGVTKWNYHKLWGFAIEGITSFSTAPLKAASYVGLITAMTAFLYASWIIYKTLRYGEPVAGYPSLMVAVLFLGGVQLAAIGVLGEYLGRMFNETKGRPLYLVETYERPRQDERDLRCDTSHPSAAGPIPHP
ncbi:glycosyltransferase family 2 protein [Thiocapsa marina]|uniref:Glycosyl transferase family 2 n=1 Tax=Thiocapsa marina 5811 TaxID=768671 RepID=F9UDZ0_9GAMM|nr:glycosyltransferase family 2 protein [Thiocapsa marina]EGV17547.1 glycosyl transferase family 2 [Thiocapsa marina 5811]